jgi:hypothetical protein
MTIEVMDAVDPGGIAPRVEDFLDALAGPTLFRVAGRDRSRIRVVSGSLHGNEPSGLRAIHRALREGGIPRTDVIFFIGGVESARAEPRFTFRTLPDRRDLNRCFRPPWEGVDGAIARDLLIEIRRLNGFIELAVDLHNNTGRNPDYAITATLDGPHVALSGLFSSRVIHSRLALGSFAEALARWCPSVTIECGQAHDAAADATAWHGLLRLLEMDRLESVVVRPDPVEIFDAAVRVELSAGLTLAFGETPRPDIDVTIDADVDRHNFQTLAAGTRIGSVRPGASFPLTVRGEEGEIRGEELFGVEESGAIVTRRSIIPIMMTTHPRIAVSDCLFYAVHRRR